MGKPQVDITLLSSQVLVFSHSVRMLDIIERLVIMAGYVYLRLDGSTKQQDRQSKVDQFNTSASVFLFLISTTAGGLGLNLTAANRSAATRRRRILQRAAFVSYVWWNHVGSGCAVVHSHQAKHQDVQSCQL